MESHLLNSSLCLALYERELHLNSLEGVIIKLYKCLSCGTPGGYQLKRHLEANVDCFTYYKSRFLVNNWTDLKKKLDSLTRASYSSRTSVKRRLEYEASKAKKKSCKTIIESIKSYREEIALANYRLCVKCLQYFLKTSALQLDNTDKLFEELDLENSSHLKRMNSFWVCLGKFSLNSWT